MKKRREELELLFQELDGNPYRRLNIAFLLIGVIPILAMAYIIFDKVFIGNKVLADIGPILFFANLTIILGYIIGYKVIKNVINKALTYAQKAKRADEIKSSFAVSLAHDLKSPLTTIKANISNLKAGFLGQLTKEQEAVVGVFKEVADRMNSIIAELIDTYMIEARIAKLKIGRIDLRDLAEEQRRELETVASAKTITLTVELPKMPLVIEADRDKMLRVINNLLSNSIKYTPQGGGVAMRAYPVEGFARMEFSNSGSIIPENRLEKIFDKFERLDTSAEGQGLGLSIAKDIVELHNGRIWATSGSGKLNCFTVLLPLAKE